MRHTLNAVRSTCHGHRAQGVRGNKGWRSWDRRRWRRARCVFRPWQSRWSRRKLHEVEACGDGPVLGGLVQWANPGAMSATAQLRRPNRGGVSVSTLRLRWDVSQVQVSLAEGKHGISRHDADRPSFINGQLPSRVRGTQKTARSSPSSFPLNGTLQVLAESPLVVIR